MKPTLPHLRFEKKLWQLGLKYLAGIDEVGRGALAGPIVVAAVIFPKTVNLIKSNLSEVKDSKLLSAKIRKKLAPLIKKASLGWSFGSASPREIERHGIVKATYLAMRRAVRSLTLADFLLIDAFHIPRLTGFPRKKQLAISMGDQRCFSIAAASILAKVHRDKLMTRLSHRYPLYRFAQHKGYGTLLHRRMLKQYGPVPIHRKTFLHSKLVAGSQ